MRPAIVRCAVFSFLLAGGLFAQTGGIPPEWEVQKQLTALSDHVKRLQPILEQLKPQDWVSQGAPQVYVDQVKGSRDQINYLVMSTKELTAHPEKLTIALETYFRMQSLEVILRSVIGGVQKYQNPAIAELLQSLLAETTGDRDQLRQYVIDLAADREQQFQVVDREAQRCRSVLSRQPRTSERK